MKSKKTLSVIPFYGGKAKMAQFISERLDYSCDIFVTMFGGACRVLLNKEPHKIEYYNEYNPCLCTLMDVLSNRDTAQQLIDRLYYETEPTREQFIQAQELYNKCRFDLEEQCRSKIVKYYRQYKHKLNEWWNSVSQEFDIDDEILDIPDKISNKKELEEMIEAWARLKKQKQDVGLENYRDMSEEVITDVDLAVATYLTYTLSYSGIGKGYVEGKFKSDDDYRKRILGLNDCADRLNGLKVLNLNAMLVFTGKKQGDNLIFQWLNDPKVMMFLDPSYFSPDKGKNGKYKNLGKIYAKSFEEEEHEKFLQGIQEAKCKILICNYDVELYNKYLTTKKGWTKEVYPTKTMVYHHSKTQKSNERLEVIWYNY